MSGEKNWENEGFEDGVMCATYGVIVVRSNWGLVPKDHTKYISFISMCTI